MLVRVKSPKVYQTQIGEMTLKDNFIGGLEFNPPVHGTWNIVHIGMSIPESHQVYVCADNCMRGVVMTAAEMNALDRFHSVVLEEQDLYIDNLETVTLEGVSAVLDRMEVKPPAVLVFPVCLHHFLHTDLKYIYKELEKRYPEIDFLQCWMDPIMQKQGLSPEQKLRKAIYDGIKAQEPTHSVGLLGEDFLIQEDSELKQLLYSEDYKIHEVQSKKTYKEFKELGSAQLLICTYPSAYYGVNALARRLNRPMIYMCPSFTYEEIDEQLHTLSRMIHHPEESYQDKKDDCDKALEELKNKIGDIEIHIDYTAHPRPLSLARLLLTHHFNVTTVYLEAVFPEEKEDFNYLKENYPELLISSTVAYPMRKMRQEKKILGIGQKTAWYSDTEYFVNIVGGHGLWGYQGILEMCRLMKEAYDHPKDTKDIIPRKGLGCESCI